MDELTYRYPRTLQQAYGWKTSLRVEPMPQKKTTPQWVLWLRRFFGGNE